MSRSWFRYRDCIRTCHATATRVVVKERKFSSRLERVTSTATSSATAKSQLNLSNIILTCLINVFQCFPSLFRTTHVERVAWRTIVENVTSCCSGWGGGNCDVCLLTCEHGSCLFSNATEATACVCQEGWFGLDCSEGTVYLSQFAEVPYTPYITVCFQVSVNSIVFLF